MERTRSISLAVGTVVYWRVSEGRSPWFSCPTCVAASAATTSVAAGEGVCDDCWTNVSQARGSDVDSMSFLWASPMPFAGRRARQRRSAHSARTSLQSWLFLGVRTRGRRDRVFISRKDYIHRRSPFPRLFMIQGENLVARG